MELYCVECKKNVDAIKVTGEKIYPHRPDLFNKIIYECPHCKNYVGTHPDGRPLGCIPNPLLKNARINAHNYIDRFWKSGKCSRSKIYKILSNHFGYRYHNGETKSIEECNEAIQVIKNYFKEGI